LLGSTVSTVFVCVGRTFGELKALRLPKKMVGTGSHRGFAFVDYYTKHDAKVMLHTPQRTVFLRRKLAVVKESSICPQSSF
jgi:multiple RNA-binding domain-containing protein 1